MPSGIQSGWLSSLPPMEFEYLARYLRSVDLAPQAVLYEPGGGTTKAYFPAGAAVSLVIGLASGQMIESAMIGRRGMLGGFAALGGGPAHHRAVVEIPGPASVIDMEQLRQAATQREGIRLAMLRHEQSLCAQAQQMAACNASHPLEARICSWLLRARDACGRSTLAITQELIAELLGVRRTSVSFAAHALQQAGMIRTRRGQIELTDPTALERSTCECYHQCAGRHRVQPAERAEETVGNALIA